MNGGIQLNKISYIIFDFKGRSVLALPFEHKDIKKMDISFIQGILLDVSL